MFHHHNIPSSCSFLFSFRGSSNEGFYKNAHIYKFISLGEKQGSQIKECMCGGGGCVCVRPLYMCLFKASSVTKNDVLVCVHLG